MNTTCSAIAHALASAVAHGAASPMAALEGRGQRVEGRGQRVYVLGLWLRSKQIATYSTRASRNDMHAGAKS